VRSVAYKSNYRNIDFLLYHLREDFFAKMMDARVKPAHDDRVRLLL